MNDEEPNNPQQSEPERVQQKNEMQLALITVALAGGMISWGTAIYTRHFYGINHAGDVNGPLGVYSFSAAVSDLFHACLLMIPTVFLIRFMSKFENVYATYLKLLLGLSVTAPVFLAVARVGSLEKTFGACLFIRLMASPFVLVGMGVSRLFARFGRAKRLTSWALVIEGVTLGIAIVLFFVR